MKKGLIVLMSILMALFVCSCNFGVKLEADNQPSSETPGAGSPGTGTPQYGGAGAGGESQTLCTITGKALYANSNDSSSIKVYIDKNEGVFTQPVLNMAFPNDLRYVPKSSERSIVSYSSCAKDGSYIFSNLEPGTYTVYAASNDSTEKAVCQSITVTRGNTTQVPDMTLTATGSISGKITVINSTDNNLGFIVFAAGTSFMAVTDSQGNFTISGIPANTSYQIIIMKGTYSYLWKTNVTATPSGNTDIGEYKISGSSLPVQNNTTTDIIHYELNGGALPEGAPVIHTFGETTILPVPTREDSVFLGFYTDSSFSGEPVTELRDGYIEGTVLYAKWLWSTAQEILSMTESGTIQLTDDLTVQEIDELHDALVQLYNMRPGVMVSLDFTDVSSIRINNNQNFNDCNNLIEITVSGVLIGNKYSTLFKECQSIESVIICSEIQQIPLEAFDNCSSLTSITIPSNVTSIGNSAFSGCSSLTSLTIPSNVTSIGNNVFSGCSRLSSITVPSSVTSIGSGVFNGCSSLTSIIIPSGVTSIGDSAFRDCTGLVGIIIPSAVTSIGNNAFLGCTKLFEVWNLSALNITKGSTENGNVGTYALGIYNSLDEQSRIVTTDDGFVFYYTLYGDGYLIGYIGTETNLILPSSFDYNGISVIGDYIYPHAFYNYNTLTGITIPTGVTRIGDYAFSGCTSLSIITIPSSVEEIDSYAFSECTSLTSVTLPSNMRSIDWGAFENCTNLKSISMPQYLKRINGYTFYNCCSLESITLPSNLEYIYSDAFFNCSGLTSITIPHSMRRIDGPAFINCTNLLEVWNLSSLNITCGSSLQGYVGYYAKVIHHHLDEQRQLVTTDDGFIFYCDNETKILVGYTGTDTNLDLPSSFDYNGSRVTQYDINAKVFYNRTNLTSITISPSVTSIGENAFQNCSSLTSITIPSSVTSIGSGAFSGCTSLTNITIPTSVTSIGSGAFSECTSLTCITIPTSVSSISSNAFNGCTSLTNITIPTSVTSIGSGAFSGCTSLTNITIPTSVTSIGSDAFGGCTSLTNITIPTSVTSIDSFAFRDCIGLMGIIIPSGVTSIGNDAFYGCTKLFEVWNLSELNFTKGSTDNGYVGYYAKVIHNSLSEQSQIVTTEDGFVLYYDNGIGFLTGYSGTDTGIVLPAGFDYNGFSVTQYNINSGALYGCTSLKNVTIPSNVLSIGENAFSGCTGLSSIYMTGTWLLEKNNSYKTVLQLSLYTPSEIAVMLGNTYASCKWYRVN